MKEKAAAESVEQKEERMSTILPGPPREPEPPRRRRLLWAGVVLLLCVAVVAAIAGAAALFGPQRPTAQPTSTQPVGQAEVGGVNGCLAGTDVTTAAMLTAQRTAPHTQQGATAFAAVIFAWMTQIPRIPAAEGTEAMKTLQSSNAASDLLDQPRQLASATFPAGLKTGRTSFVNGKYLIASATADEVRVSVGGSAVYNGQRADSDTAAMTFDLVWEGGMWKLKNNDQAQDVTMTFKSGTPFAGGC
ncbi:hypothetical protein SPF06_19715 [Sinomonas sp. JGH33]|uniref:Uncharacterized protein n=1 Tax=Sinomonas terricola TaxID=3110330 RepID=A0ABU5TBZ0_9MICC|nr:hypothetical protein [Sinomonas sp. JGH33]MEA5456956.1 hypothetical protein [Sinomonas sp. JGH33]